jgi:hypothetical protein
MATRKKMTFAELADFHERKAKEYRERDASGKFDTALAKHKNAINALYADMKAASGKQRGVDSAILTALAEAMGMKGMTITKKVQQRKPK